MRPGTLRNTTVLVAGAGLAGLTAAREVRRLGGKAIVVEARDRVGGRVWTIRDEFAASQHAEAGGDLIDQDQTEIRRLAEDLGLHLTRILRRGFSFYDRRARKIAGVQASWRVIGERLEPYVRLYQLVEQRWDSPIAGSLARHSVSDWLTEIRADEDLRIQLTALRGFFLADPEELSLLALVDAFASSADAGMGPMYRIREGNDALATTIARDLGASLRLGICLRRVSQRASQIEAAADGAEGAVQITADYALIGLPASTLRRVEFDPPLPEPQREAIARLPYGRATRTLLQFDRPFWRRIGRARAYGTTLPIGAVWDGSEGQRGASGILTLLAGGSASDQTQMLLAERGAAGLVKELRWLAPGAARLIANHSSVWERDRWAGGGYAVFGPHFEPALRAWLARPFGRIVFAGEHTSLRWQGYMNGAVESGLRAVAEIVAMKTQL